MKLILSRARGSAKCHSILQLLKPIDGIPVPNGQLLFLSSITAAIRGSTLGF